MMSAINAASQNDLTGESLTHPKRHYKIVFRTKSVFVAQFSEHRRCWVQSIDTLDVLLKGSTSSSCRELKHVPKANSHPTHYTDYALSVSVKLEFYSFSWFIHLSSPALSSPRTFVSPLFLHLFHILHLLFIFNLVFRLWSCFPLSYFCHVR